MKFLLISLFLTGVLALPQSKTPNNSLRKQFRIVGGQVAKLHQFPYIVGIRLIRQKNNGPEYTSWCGGALISEKAVITSAHCLENTVRMILHFATHNRWENVEADRVTVEVKRKNFIIHENFILKYLYNDIALIILPEKIETSDKIQTVDLPRRSQSALEGRIATASGWGKQGYKLGSSDVLQYVLLKVVNSNECGKFGTLKPEQFCANGHGPKSTCEGDSGGPFVLEETDGSKTLIGLTSFGSFTCEKEYPMVFTRITSFLDWISKHTGIPIRN